MTNSGKFSGPGGPGSIRRVTEGTTQRGAPKLRGGRTDPQWLSGPIPGGRGQPPGAVVVVAGAAVVVDPAAPFNWLLAWRTSATARVTSSS